MPVFLIVMIGFGLAIFVILAFMHGGTSKPTPVSDARLRKMWVVDEDSTGQDL